MKERYSNATPFVKWAGGKRGLLERLSQYSDIAFNEKKCERYIEPFVGGGAMLFYVLSNYNVKEIIINDINGNLINCYNCIKDSIDELIEQLNILKEKYETTELKKIFYLDVRKIYNESKNDFDAIDVKKAAEFIFLNRVCFNGLYRVNRKGEFNVPFGRYENPLICDRDNLKKCHLLLQSVTILQGDYSSLSSEIDNKTFVYLDPPYRPLKKNVSFTSYDEAGFSEQNQKELEKFCEEINNRHGFFLLSNSDPKVSDETDNFFDDLYKSFNINRVNAKRSINSNGEKRSAISELLITNLKERECNKEILKNGSLHLETA